MGAQREAHEEEPVDEGEPMWQPRPELAAAEPRGDDEDVDEIDPGAPPRRANLLAAPDRRRRLPTATCRDLLPGASGADRPSPAVSRGRAGGE